LLEALRFNPDLSIETLRTYLMSRVPELSEHHWRPVQHPWALVPNNGTVYRPIFSATSQAAISNWVPNLPNRPEPARRLPSNSPNPPQNAGSAMVAYQEPQRKATPKARKKSGTKIFNSLVIGIAGMAIAIGSVLALVWSPSKKAPLEMPTAELNGAELSSVQAKDGYQPGQDTIKTGDARSYAQAIALEQQVPADHPTYNQAQQSIADLSKKIYLLAQSQAESKNWQQAIDTAQLVPKNSPLYPAAQNSIQLWQNKR
jgi:hypothetical protein